MPTLLSGLPITEEEQEANDRHDPVMVLAVLVFLAVYMYLFTFASQSCARAS